jgi:hypothetical protein
MAPAMYRKYAFHLILAGHRYGKANQRPHGLVCYHQSLQVYRGRGWSLAEDHIYFTIGRQAFYLADFALALHAFSQVRCLVLGTCTPQSNTLDWVAGPRMCGIHARS